MDKEIMEADSKNKRGRPTVAQKIMFGSREDGDKYENSFISMYGHEYESKRSITNQLYYQEGFRIIESCIPDYKKIFFTPNDKRFKAKAVVEQIGRMKIQNNYDDESCRMIAELSVDMLKQGWKVKKIESFIRKRRNSGNWEL